MHIYSSSMYLAYMLSSGTFRDFVLPILEGHCRGKLLVLGGVYPG